jgi:hypothetical protein
MGPVQVGRGHIVPRGCDTKIYGVNCCLWSTLTMTSPCERYGRTEVGRCLEAIVNDPARYPEYRAFSREGYPAVMAIMSLVRPELERLQRADPREFHIANQYVGWAVGQVMRAHGHQIVGRRRVAGRLITQGAVWCHEPVIEPAAPKAA